MRIVSNFKDYYDGLQDPEDTLVWRRFMKGHGEIPKVLKSAWQTMPMPGTTDRSFNGYLNRYIIAFCGRYYPIYKFFMHANYSEYSDSGIESCPADGFYTNPTDLVRAIEALPEKSHSKSYDERVRDLKKRFAPRKKRKYDEYEWGETRGYRKLTTTLFWSKAGWDRWQLKHKNNTISDDVFRELDAPAFVIWCEKYDKGFEIRCNPCLNEYGFAKILDPYQAYQELDMYLGNQLAKQEDPVPHRTQELIRDAHGFDDKSFKQIQPGMKKARRKANRERKRMKKK
jgi:hypothetical protein